MTIKKESPSLYEESPEIYNRELRILISGGRFFERKKPFGWKKYYM